MVGETVGHHKNQVTFLDVGHNAGEVAVVREAWGGGNLNGGLSSSSGDKTIVKTCIFFQRCSALQKIMKIFSIIRKLL